MIGGNVGYCRELTPLDYHYALRKTQTVVLVTGGWLPYLLNSLPRFWDWGVGRA